MHTLKALAVALSSLTLLAAGAANAAVVNGGFETGTFAGWIASGFTGNTQPSNAANHTTATFLTSQNGGTAATQTNGVVTSQSTFFNSAPTGAAVAPTEGNHLAFISNESSQGSLQGSSIRQSFAVGGGDTAISFDVDFLSAEALGTSWDFGGVALMTMAGQILAEFTLDHNASTASAAMAHATGAAVGGAQRSTGWISRSFDLVPYAGQTLTLLAYSLNTGDASVESRLLLDNVSVISAVPEPVSIALVGVGVAGMLALRRRRFA